MANPNKLWGQTRITANGLYLQTEGKSSIEVGGVNRTSVEGDFKAGFFTEMTKPSKVEVNVLVQAGVSLTQLQGIDDATLLFECDTGQVYVVRHAYVSDAVSASEGKAKLVFMGPPAEEQLA